MPKAPPRSAARRWLVRLAVLLGLGLAAAGVVRLLPKKAVAVRAVRPARGAVRDVVSSSTAGEVMPVLRATVRAEIAGRVTAVLHEAGERVKSGEPIVRLDASDLDARLAQAEAAVQAARSQVAQGEARVQTLTRQAERARMLLSRGAGTAQISEDADAAVREAGQAVAAARGQLQQALAALRVAQVARRHADLLAPFDGILTEVQPAVGETLSPGVPVFQIIDDRRLHVDATIDEADAARVRPGQEAELRLDALPDQVIRGRVAKVDPAIQRDLKGARTLGVEVEVQDMDEARRRGLKPGMSANVDIIVAEKQDVMWLPTGAIVGRGVGRAVLVLRPEGRSHHRAVKTAVQVGLSNWERTEILAGVTERDLVAASLNQKGLEDGALVQVTAEREGQGAP